MRFKSLNWFVENVMRRWSPGSKQKTNPAKSGSKQTKL
jgi:hypothetical protein